MTTIIHAVVWLIQFAVVGGTGFVVYMALGLVLAPKLPERWNDGWRMIVAYILLLGFVWACATAMDHLVAYIFHAKTILVRYRE